MSGLERQVNRGAQRITPAIVKKFGVMVAEKLRGKDPVLRQAYVRLLVNRVEVAPKEVRITGSKAALEHAVLDPRAAGGAVPGLDREWCPKQDEHNEYVLPLTLP